MLYDSVFAKLTRIRILELDIKNPPDSAEMIFIGTAISSILLYIPEPTLDQITFHLDFTGFLGATDHDISRIRPSMANMNRGLHGGFIEQMKLIQERKCFSRLTRVEVLLHFRYNKQRWDVCTAKSVAEHFMERMRAYFIAWETRGIVNMTCSTTDGTYRLPESVTSSE